MQLKDTIRESQAFLNRTIVAGLLVTLAVATLAWRMVQLQIIDHEHFTTLSRENRVKVLPLPPTRGLIYDRKGVLIAGNEQNYRIVMVREDAGDPEAVARLVGCTDADIALAVVSRWRGRFSQAVLVVDQFEELFTLNPGEVQARFTELLGRLDYVLGDTMIMPMPDDDSEPDFAPRDLQQAVQDARRMKP